MKWYTHNLLMQLFTLYSTKIEVSEGFFMRLLEKILILHGDKPTSQPLGVGRANRPKKVQNGGVCGVFPYIRGCLALT